MSKSLEEVLAELSIAGQNGIFEIYKDQSDEQRHRWRLKAPNGEIIAHGQGYSSKQGCEKGIDAVRKYAKGAILRDLT